MRDCMKFIKKEPIKERVWIPCPDLKSWTLKEKLHLIYLNPILLFGWFFSFIFGKGVFFTNCQHTHECQCVRYTLFGNCEAGEWNED